jgi:phosphopantothenoylcysteine decarboxylase / phosphopantothenate---cysteine ligase
MSNYKILFKITGSIAAYKSTFLISKLVQSGCDVKVVATESALKFVGKATLEGLTGHTLYTDSFADGEMMGHINLMKWADLIIVCPATANTINKLANGIGDNLLTSLFLAFDWSKPYLIAPAMNTKMYDHPATKNSMNKLIEWGVKILPTNEGYLACGDTGKGKLLEPVEIFEQIFLALKEENHDTKGKIAGNTQLVNTEGDKLKILITAGGTKENIDGIRYLSNLSTGKTGAAIAGYFSLHNHDVTLLHAVDSAVPQHNCEIITYFSFSELDDKLKLFLGKYKYDAVIHLAAVGDYSVDTLETNGELISLPLSKKLDSENKLITLHLKRNKKIISRLKSYSKNKNILVVGFKLTNTLDLDQRSKSVQKLIKESGCSYVVQNDRNERTSENNQANFTIYNKHRKIDECVTPAELSEKLESLLIKDTRRKK